MSRRLRVLLLENAPGHNKGEIAIMFGLLEEFRQLGVNAEVRMLSPNPKADAIAYGGTIGLVPVRTGWPFVARLGGRSPIGSLDTLVRHILFSLSYRWGGRRSGFWSDPLWRAYAEADVLIMGHDSSFGLGGDLENPLLYPIYIPFIARILGKPLLFHAGTIPEPPPRHRHVAAWLFRVALGRINGRTVRDARSAQLALAISGGRLRIPHTCDPAFLMPPATAEQVDTVWRAEGMPERRPLIGMTVSRTRACRALPLGGDEAINFHIEALAEVIDRVIDALGVDVILFGHNVGPSQDEDDRVIAGMLRDRCCRAACVHVIAGNHDPRILKGMIGRCDIFVGERLHSVIAASSQCVPTLAITYRSDPRAGMVAPLLRPEDILYIEGLRADAMFERLMATWKERERMRARLHRILPTVLATAALNAKLVAKAIPHQYHN